MSKKRIEAYIPKAIEVLSKAFPSSAIPSSYNGYISSFGASVIQSGLKPTLALFENTNASTKEDKSFLVTLILQMLDEKTHEISLLTYVLNKPQEEELLKAKIIDCAIALKLSIRTFTLEK